MDAARLNVEIMLKDLPNVEIIKRIILNHTILDIIAKYYLYCIIFCGKMILLDNWSFYFFSV